MSTEQICFSIKRGDTWSKTLYFMDDDETIVDITGWTIFMTVKSKSSDLDGSAVISKTVTVHSRATEGIAELELTPTDTAISIGSYLFDIQVKTEVGEIYTILEGMLDITRDITIRTS